MNAGTTPARAGGSAGGGTGGGGWRHRAPGKPRDRHVDPSIRRKLTDAERRYLDDLFHHLDHLDRMLTRCAARHHEPL